MGLYVTDISIYNVSAAHSDAFNNAIGSSSGSVVGADGASVGMDSQRGFGIGDRVRMSMTSGSTSKKPPRGSNLSPTWPGPGERGSRALEESLKHTPKRSYGNAGTIEPMSMICDEWWGEGEDDDDGLNSV